MKIERVEQQLYVTHDNITHTFLIVAGKPRDELIQCFQFVNVACNGEALRICPNCGTDNYIAKRLGVTFTTPQNGLLDAQCAYCNLEYAFKVKQSEVI